MRIPSKIIFKKVEVIVEINKKYLINTAMILVYVLFSNKHAGDFLGKTHLFKSFWQIDSKGNSSGERKIKDCIKSTFMSDFKNYYI